MHASGAAPDRLLMIGSGAVTGYGVLSWDLSLSGRLAKDVAAITGRGIDMDISSDPRVDVDAATAIVAGVNIARYDGIILMLGALEALNFYPPERWKSHLLALIEAIRAGGPASVRVWFVAVPPLTSLTSLPRPVRSAVNRHVDTFNRIIAEACRGSHGVQFLPLRPRAQPLIDNATTSVHGEWAALIAPGIAKTLDVDAPRPLEVVDEAARLEALRNLHILDGPPDHELQQLVESAREVFGVASASFNLIEDDLQRVKVTTGPAAEPLQMPRSESLCTVTIAQSRLFVITDTLQTREYRDKPFVTGPPYIRFYAGYPIEAPDGQRIGSLCIIDMKPRAFGTAEATLLRDLALRVQARVWAQNAVLRR